jgi:hypothetical protein
MNIQGYNLALEDSKQRMQRELRLGEWLKTNQKAINAHWRTIEAFITKHEGKGFYRSISSQPAYHESDTHTVFMSLTLRQLDGLKDPVLEEAMMPFIDATKTTCTDYPNYLNRDYNFLFEVPGGKIHILVGAYVKEENPTCRKILVERKAVTQVVEVFRMACDGDIIEGQEPSVKLEAPAPAADPNVIDI